MSDPLTAAAAAQDVRNQKLLSSTPYAGTHFESKVLPLTLDLASGDFTAEHDTALAALESHLRKRQAIAEPFTVADAVAALVKFRAAVHPNPAWRSTYRAGLDEFERRVRS